MSFLSEFAPIHSVNEAMNTNQQFRLRTLGIHALRNRNQAHPSEGKPLIEVERIRKLAGQAGSIINENTVKRTAGRACRR
ncbi:MAG: hypothetical protein DMG37_20360 [Acidobacteria bacterium]|nr:MAG: hypothetical protein DMG37_20360 [Acidobacteriota bacterium]